MKGAIFALFLLSNNWNFFPNISNITTNRHIYYIYMWCEHFKLAIEEGTAKIQRWHTLGGWKRRAQAHNALEGWLCSLFKTKKCGVWFRRWKEKRNGSCSCWTASCPTPWRSRPHRCYSTIERLWFSRRIKKRCDNYQIWRRMECRPLSPVSPRSVPTLLSTFNNTAHNKLISWFIKKDKIVQTACMEFPP